MNFKYSAPDRDRRTHRYTDHEDDAPAAAQPVMRSSGCESSGEAFVAMMQATDLRYGYDAADPGWLDRARDGAILIERKMGAGSMIVVDIGRQDAAQMALVEDHNMIQTLAANRAYDLWLLKTWSTRKGTSSVARPRPW